MTFVRDLLVVLARYRSRQAQREDTDTGGTP